LVDIAPRIIFALENIIISMPILVKSTAPENIKKVLKILSGFDPIESHMYNEVSSSNIYVVQDVIPKTLHDYRFDSMRLGIVRSKLLLNLRSTHSKRIFLDRKRGLFRPMQNKSQIRRLLRSFGFIFIYPEDLDILDSVGLFYGAEIIIGESGAALSNIMFMNPSSVFIELYPGYGDVGFWRRYAQNFDINYFELSGTSRMIGLQGIAMDGFRISRKALKKLLLEILH
jgi:capsular polysaccharide biosynthesis protein